MQEQTFSGSVRTGPGSLAVAVGFALALAAPSAAELITVNVGTDGTGTVLECELRDAIVAANTDAPIDGCVGGSGADEIHFNQAGTVTLSADLPAIEQDLELVGLGSGQTIVSGVGLYRQISAIHFITVRVADLTLRDGMNSVGGGCLESEAASLIVEDVRFDSCETSGNGGAALVFDGMVTFHRCLFVNNTAMVNGGAMSLTSDSATIEDSTFVGNSAGSTAGALSVGGVVQATVMRTTFENNSSMFDGGAIRIFSPIALLVLEHCTFTRNQSNAGTGGALVEASGTVTLHNTIMAGNLSATGSADLFKTAITTMTSFGNNLIGDNGSPESPDVALVFPEGVNANGDIVGTSAVPIEPMLGPLGDNGGPLPTVLPQTGSPAIDQGACAGQVADQRGFGNFATGLRVVDVPSVANQADGCDIGAVEILANDAFFADGFETGDTLQWSLTTP